MQMVETAKEPGGQLLALSVEKIAFLEERGFSLNCANKLIRANELSRLSKSLPVALDDEDFQHKGCADRKGGGTRKNGYRSTGETN